VHADHTPIPVESDFIYPGWDGLDERSAMRTFLGKTSAEAEEMFRSNFLRHQEDLTYMGAAAFRFYVLPTIRYLLSDAATGDAEAASTFPRMIDSRLCSDEEALLPVLPAILDAIRQMLADFDRYGCLPDIYGDLPTRYRWLADRLEKAGERG
jgi:hypothetical protein